MQSQEQFCIQIQDFACFQLELQRPLPAPQPESMFPQELYYTLEDPPVSVVSTIGKRERNLDKFSYIKEQNYTIVGLYDGHGDDSVSIFLQNCLIRKIVTHPSFQKFPEQAIKQSFSELSQNVISDTQMFPNQRAGSTALVALVCKSDQYVYIANLGDCQAYGLINNQEGESDWIKLTTRHNLTQQSELKRVIQTKGLVFRRGNQYRINGQMLLSRGFGGRAYKECFSSDPQIIKILKEDVIRLVLGSDGFWQNIEQPNFREHVQKVISKLQNAQVNAFSDNATVCFLQI